ncbi:trypsin inhibitor A-like [Vigna radiata var. radiata]|uniref:Trypsin inhibitor A-like n=1 Tax=Vigna radiata var. radiata TaxID=3916 RepID=A0A1S3TH25_VIGRR|nr:trypsin inhibitor A-like [Vigna radiata var. radiata]
MASKMLFALFLLSVLTFYPPSTDAAPVKDLHGNIVKNGGRFHILPLFTIAGGIRRIKTGNETIPLSVVQSPSEVDNGLPLIITSFARTGFLSTGQATISFADDSSLEWTAVAGFPEGTLVKVSGYTYTIRGTFSIKNVRANIYKLVFCKFGGDLCGNVALVGDDAGNRLLGINQKDPYEFVLEEIPSSSAASK